MSIDTQSQLSAAAPATGRFAHPAAVPGSRARRITQSSLLIALSMVAAAILVLLGWLLDVAALKSVIPV